MLEEIKKVPCDSTLLSLSFVSLFLFFLSCYPTLIFIPLFPSSSSPLLYLLACFLSTFLPLLSSLFVFFFYFLPLLPSLLCFFLSFLFCALSIILPVLSSSSSSCFADLPFSSLFLSSPFSSSPFSFFPFLCQYVTCIAYYIAFIPVCFSSTGVVREGRTHLAHGFFLCLSFPLGSLC